jgi:hypothetical protein
MKTCHVAMPSLDGVRCKGTRGCMLLVVFDCGACGIVLPLPLQLRTGACCAQPSSCACNRRLVASSVLMLRVFLLQTCVFAACAF